MSTQNTSFGPTNNSHYAHIGYAWYHFSGAKTAVNTARQAHDYYQDTKRSIAENAPKNPNEVIQFLRSTAKSYAGLVPGVSKYVDSAFDALDELHETHGEDVDKILRQGYDEIRQILKDGNSGADAQTGMKVMDVLRTSSSQLEEVGKRVGQDMFQKLGEQYPELKEKLGGGYEELRKAAEKNGPEAKRIFDETTSQVRVLYAPYHLRILTFNAHIRRSKRFSPPASAPTS